MEINLNNELIKLPRTFHGGKSNKIDLICFFFVMTQDLLCVILKKYIALNFNLNCNYWSCCEGGEVP